MKHAYYSKSNQEKLKTQFLIGFLAILIITLFFWISWLTRIYFIGFFVFALVLSILAPFFDTPSMVASGKIKYQSLLFLSEKLKKNVINIHGGTWFDYVFVLDKSMEGKQRTAFIIQQYVEGLLNLIEEHRNVGELTSSNVKIRGTSYIINTNTAMRIGFRVVETDAIQKLILAYNYFNVLIAYSIAKGKLSFPNLKHTQTFETTLKDLINKEAYLKQLNEKLKRPKTNLI